MICTTPSDEFLEDQFRKAKELGLNCLRCHIKAPDPRYYDAADRIGLLIWTELPNGGISTDRSRARKEATLKGIVDRDSHHPSIIIWTIINENWGVDLVHDSEHRDWLKKMYHWLKAYDPSRLVVDNSPLSPSFHVETDIADYHFYAGYPDNRRAWDRFVKTSLHALHGSSAQKAMRRRPAGTPALLGIRKLGTSRSRTVEGPQEARNHGGSKPAMTGAKASCIRMGSRTALPTGASTGFRRFARLRGSCAVAAVSRVEIRDRDDAARARTGGLCHHGLYRYALGEQRPARHVPQPARFPSQVRRDQHRCGYRAALAATLLSRR